MCLCRKVVNVDASHQISYKVLQISLLDTSHLMSSKVSSNLFFTLILFEDDIILTLNR